MTTDPLERVKAFFAEGDAPARPRRGRYEIVREVGRGGMAVVSEAFDPELGRRVALKVLKEGNLERLRREAAAAAKLRHPNVVAIHEVGPDFIAMDFIEGKTLAEAAPSGLRERVALLETVARAVGYAHSQGVIHRDLKPANVIVEPSGRPVLTDFGLAKILGGEDLTQTGAVVGTPHYMAPEQVKGEGARMGPATDVWALGVMLYETVAGRRPFEGGTALEVYEKIVREDPRLPGELGAVAEKALAKDPGRRYPDATAMADDLARWLAGEDVTARPPGPGERIWRRVRRNPAAYAGGAVAALAFAAAVGVGLLGKVGRLDALREQARVSLEAALELRRAGANARMRQFLAPLESAYRQAPDLAEVEYLMGRMHRALLEEDKALEYQRRALAKDPAFGPALYERAVLLSLRHGRELKVAIDAEQGEGGPGEEALAKLGEAILRDAAASRPAAPEAVRVARGLAAYHRGDRAEAREHLEAALRMDPLLEEAREALTQVVRSELRATVGDRERAWKRAEDLYTQGLARDQGYLPHYMGRGQLRWSRGSSRRHRGLDPMADYGAAAEDFTKAIELAPASPDPWSWRGQARVYHGIWRDEVDQDPRPDLAAAESDTSRALEIDRTHARSWMWRGAAKFYRARYALERGGDPRAELEGAERDLTEAIRLEPNPGEALKWRGRTRALHGAAVARYGGDPESHFASSEADFVRTLPRGDRDTWTLTWRSTAWSERGIAAAARGRDPRPDFDRAEELLGESVRLNLHHMEGWKHRGFVRWHRARYLEAAGDRAAAREAYAGAASDFTEALSINPTLRFQIGVRVEEARKKAAGD